jgi:hypothetical protein
MQYSIQQYFSSFCKEKLGTWGIWSVIQQQRSLKTQGSCEQQNWRMQHSRVAHVLPD